MEQYETGIISISHSNSKLSQKKDALLWLVNNVLNIGFLHLCESECVKNQN